MIRGKRLVFKNVDAGARQPPLGEGPGECGGVHDGPAGRVDDNGGGLHPPQFGPAEKGARFIREGWMERHEIRLPKQRRIIHEDGSRIMRRGAGDIRVECEAVEAERSRIDGDTPPDPPESDDPQSLSPEPVDERHDLGPLQPATGSESGIILRDAPVEGEEQDHRVEGHLLSSVIRHVGHTDPRLRRSSDVYRVISDAVPGDEEAPGHAGDHVRINLDELVQDRIRAGERGPHVGPICGRKDLEGDALGTRDAFFRLQGGKVMVGDHSHKRHGGRICSGEVALLRLAGPGRPPARTLVPPRRPGRETAVGIGPSLTDERSQCAYRRTRDGGGDYDFGDDVDRSDRVTSWLGALPYALVAAGAVLRIAPHPPNLAPIGAIALFGGAVLPRGWAFVVPLAALMLSDAVLGSYPGMVWVYGSFVLITLIGMALRQLRTVLRLAGAALLSSVLFFVVTNLGEWFGPLYPHTLAGLWTDYVAAIPFFRNTALSDLGYTLAFFGLHDSAGRLVRRRAAHLPSSVQRTT